MIHTKFSILFLSLFIINSCSSKKNIHTSIKPISIEAEVLNVTYPLLKDWMKAQTNDSFIAIYQSDNYTFQMDTNAVVSTSDNIIYTISSDKKHIAFVGKSNGEGWIEYKIAGKQEIKKPFVVNLVDEQIEKYIQLINTNNLPDVTLLQYGKTIKNFNIKDIKLPALIIGGFNGCGAFDLATNDLNNNRNLLPTNINYYLFTTDCVVNNADAAIKVFNSSFQIMGDDTSKVTNEVTQNIHLFGNNIYKILAVDFKDVFISSPTYIYIDENGFIKHYDYGGPGNDEKSRKRFLIKFIKKLRSL